MAQVTTIEWTDLSWNPTHGCSRVSTGCKNCYAETKSRRYRHTPKPWTKLNAPENVLLKPHRLREPLSNAKEWRGLGAAAAAAGKTDGMLVFVNSMSDLFHEEIPDHYIAEVFAVMMVARQHTFQVLTKRPERMTALLDDDFRETVFRHAWELCEAHDLTLTYVWPLPNVWLGVSIENRKWVGRADVLRQTPAAVRFISAEPLLGPLVCVCGGSGYVMQHHPVTGDGEAVDCPACRGPSLDLTRIDWLIVGGESGPKHRPMREEWVHDLRDTCVSACSCSTLNVEGGADHVHRPAFFFKQWGGARPGGEALLDGREWREFPQVRNRREYGVELPEQRAA